MTKKLLNGFGKIFLIFVLIAGTFALYQSFQSKDSMNQPPSIFGYQMMAVLSGSMEPILSTGDIVVTKKTPPENIETDDVITYQNSDGTLITHRVIELTKIDGKTFFQTQGDANNIEDEILISTDRVIGTMQFHIPKIGYVTQFFKSTLGIMLLVTALVFLLGLKPLMKALASDEKEEQEDIAT